MTTKKKSVVPSRKKEAQKKVVKTASQVNNKKLSTNSKRQNTITNKSFPIVGIGASAGGLEAVSELLANLPPDTGMAFVIVLHLDPTHISRIDEILSRKTLMTVTEIKNNMRAQSNHVYIIPPNSSLKFVHGTFKVLPRLESKGIHLPIDTFFTSLAKDQANKSIGIVLSGTASDGTQGLGAIKAEGGLTIAQDPKSSKYDSMPRSAIVAGVVDFILPPNQIADELTRIAEHPLIIGEIPEQERAGSSKETAKHDVEGCFDKILKLLENKSHVDFSHYKRNTLDRRIARRMVLLKKEHLTGYLKYLETNPDEIESLFEDLLINVTEFFRDPHAYDVLKAKIFPEIMKKRAANSPVRIWVVGCATGEEVYSVVMSLLEYIGELTPIKPIQIFATDISEQAIQKARAGIYPETISKNVSTERLQRFFVKIETGGYRIKSFIREMCLFSRHDVTSDPPYAKLDLICCRNLLIYFDQTLQEHVLPLFHYALKPNGFLWLGSAENVGKLFSPFFNLVDKTNRFYSRKTAPSMPRFHFPASAYIPEKLEITKKFSVQGYSQTDISHETDRIAALKYAPPSVVVNQAMEIILIRGEIAPYLQLTQGQASLNLFKLAQTELVSDLRMLLRIAKKKNASARKDGFTLRIGKQLKTFSIDILPFTFTMASQIKERYFLISFEPTKHTAMEYLQAQDVSHKRTKSSDYKSSKRDQQHLDSKNRYIRELEQEQLETKSYQKSLIQDFEITQEELTSTNEELQSTIEELQSTNEELETAKEELQSTNEELTTVNDELQSRNIDLSKIYDDLVNLIECVDIPIVMVSIDGCVRRFTPKAGEMFNLIQSDTGRPISDINPNFDVPDLGAFVQMVINTDTIKEINVQDRKGRWFRLQVRPYKTTENKIDGAVIALVDINLLKTNLMESKISLDYANSIANTVHLPLIVLDKQLRMQSANHAFYEKFQATPKQVGMDLLALIGINKKAASYVRQALTDAFVENIELKDFEIECEFSRPKASRTNMRNAVPVSKRGTLILNGRRIQWIGDEPNAFLLCIQDITDRIKMEKSLKHAVTQSKKADQYKDAFLAILSHELRTPLTAILCWAQLLLKTEEGSKKLVHGLKAIEQNSKIQGQLIDDLLDVSRIKSGKLVLSTSILDPGDVVQRAVESVRPLAESKSLTIKSHIKPLGGKVAADSRRLQQIVWNLLTNAIKFSPPKEKIEVSVEAVEEHKQSFAAIQVIDHGKGIKPDFLPQLFDRFTQADSTTTRLHGGLGLGLTIANDLLKLMGGSIRAESEGERKGATFTVFLPLIRNPPKPNMNATKLNVKTPVEEVVVREGKETQLWQKLEGLTILIVEDEQSSLDAIAELLNFAGANTIPVTSAAEAIIALDTYKPNILISDIAMSGEDGISLIKNIRARRN